MSALTDVFTAIANAIRAKAGVQTTYKPDEMATAISNLPSALTKDMAQVVVNVRSYNSSGTAGVRATPLFISEEDLVTVNAMSIDTRISVICSVESLADYVDMYNADIRRAIIKKPTGWYLDTYTASETALNRIDNIPSVVSNPNSSARFDVAYKLTQVTITATVTVSTEGYGSTSNGYYWVSEVTLSQAGNKNHTFRLQSASLSYGGLTINAGSTSKSSVRPSLRQSKVTPLTLYIDNEAVDTFEVVYERNQQTDYTRTYTITESILEFHK